MSQLAPFRQEPFFAKNGHTVPGGFAPALLLALAFALALALGLPFLPAPLPPALPPPFRRSKRLLVARIPTGGQCTLAQLFVVRVRATVSLGTVTVVTEVKADLPFCITALTLTLGSGVCLVCSGLSGCLGCGLDFRLELRKLLLGVGELARVRVCAGARGRCRRRWRWPCGPLPFARTPRPLCGTPPTSVWGALNTGVSSAGHSRLSALISF